VVQPAPAPRFGRSRAGQPGPPRKPGADTDEVLGRLGIGPERIAELRAQGTVG
jgi:alpha-methylacyl-CoA racemase